VDQPAAGVEPVATTTAAGAASGSEAGAGRARLRLSFSADSWVDVHDAAGRRIFSGYGRANSVKVVAGDAPLRVYLGYASGVQLEINEHAVAIARPFVHGDVARFQAGADGVLRGSPNSAQPRG
jgi:cytoskeleton protein RodZ